MLGFDSPEECSQVEHVLKELLGIPLGFLGLRKLSKVGVKNFVDFLDFASNPGSTCSLLVGVPCGPKRITQAHCMQICMFARVHAFALGLKETEGTVAAKLLGQVCGLSWSEYQDFMGSNLYQLLQSVNTSPRVFPLLLEPPEAPKMPKILALQLKIWSLPKLPSLKVDHSLNNAPSSVPITPIV